MSFNLLENYKEKLVEVRIINITGNDSLHAKPSYFGVLKDYDDEFIELSPAAIEFASFKKSSEVKRIFRDDLSNYKKSLRDFLLLHQDLRSSILVPRKFSLVELLTDI
ncbi:hypothetical protein HYX19_03445 [Candidatus Woesearchaeota archaeon]|nr:hypothetical protein [Candidatus Woesearchaeota archaeon]